MQREALLWSQSAAPDRAWWWDIPEIERTARRVESPLFLDSRRWYLNATASRLQKWMCPQNTWDLKYITLYAIFCIFQVVIATVKSKIASHVHMFGLYRRRVHRWGYDSGMVQTNKLVSFDDHILNEMFARVISTNCLVGNRYLCMEATAPGIFLRKSGFYAGMFLSFRAHARARYQAEFSIFLMSTF